MKMVVVLSLLATLVGGCSKSAQRCDVPEMTSEGALKAAIDRLQSETSVGYLIGETPQIADDPIDADSCCTVTRRQNHASSGDSWHVTTEARINGGRVLAYTDFDLCGNLIDTGEIIESNMNKTGR